jgi:formylmethanofuran dehydrogenase subunit C
LPIDRTIAKQRTAILTSICLTLLKTVPSAELHVDASALSLDRLRNLSKSQIADLSLDSNLGPIRLAELFEIDLNTSPCHQAGPTESWIDDALILRGPLNQFRGLCASTASGTTVVLGDVGDDFAKSQRGGNLFVDGSVGQRALADKRDGLALIRSDAGDNFGCPLPGKLQGIQGGDSIVLGNLGHRACERMRRGTLCVAGNVGNHLAHQWIAGTILAMGTLGPHFGTQMRRGSLIVPSKRPESPGASLSPYRPLELSFLPILWRYLHRLILHAASCPWLDTAFQARCNQLASQIPTTPHVLRSIGDLECQGQGEVLVLQENQHRSDQPPRNPTT